jgi:hypothetical protein
LTPNRRVETDADAAHPKRYAVSKNRSRICEG